MVQQIIITVLSVAILLLMAGVFAYIYLQSLLAESSDLWAGLKQNLRLRLDLLPRLIELIRKDKGFDNDQIFRLIEIRKKSWPIEVCTSNKVSLEMEISEILMQLMKFATASSQLAKDSNYLSLKKELEEITEQLESRQDKYNTQVRLFNKKIASVPWNFLSQWFKIKRQHIFEF